MDKLKFALFAIISLTLLGLGVYWAVNTIQTGSEYVSIEKLETLGKENEELKKEVQKFKNEVASLKLEIEAEKQEANIIEAQPKVETPAPAKATYKNQVLINELQKLADGNFVIKLKSNGTRVGTIQKFLNLYNKTSNRVDNDFGESTKNAVAAFQKDQGLSADGEAGKSTFLKMIDWLKKQG
jgi:murein L,D-transpeptidase YcbB/YkuD